MSAPAKPVASVEDIYPLAPLQQGMLFHSLYEAGSYVQQLTWLMRGELDAAAFEQAWQYVIDRHAVLRTAFVWAELDEPLQVVRPRVRVSFENHDWRSMPAAQRDELLAGHRQSAKEAGFDLARAPLMRFALIRTADDAYEFTWTYHHLLLNGWSLLLVLREAFACYESIRQGRAVDLPLVQPYRDYIAWLQRQDMAEAEMYW
jgi:hypothetical protein